MKDLHQAYVKSNLELKPSGNGNLDDLTFSVKDVFAIKKYLNTAGNPDWYRTHKPAEEHAEVIERLLLEGATLKGTTHTDEIMYSLNGENHHYGTPVNPKAPNRIPGGSSSGSAVAVAANLVDFALGTDTGGSVRIPSSYCGIFGFRPTHGSVSLKGVIPLAKSFDTVGWMTRDPILLQTIGKAILPFTNDEDNTSPFKKLIFGGEPWNLVDDTIKESLSEGLEILDQSVSKLVEEEISVEGLEIWADIFKTLQGKEIWTEHGPWIEKEDPYFGPGIKERFAMASKISQSTFDRALERQLQIQKQMNVLLGKDGILAIPTAPGPAPLKDMPSEALNDYRGRAMQLTCIAGLSGLPQVTIPVAQIEGNPIGLSLIANRGQDRRLLEFVANYFYASK
ncbi:MULTISPECIES: amidase [Paraliobacillus]|uniref:amidase n=1 Tax=Paraliobacillus TaxID=200903 RepID=UPI000DD40154|nr:MULTISPECIES: amidase [Paraliobacillus]